MDSSLVPQELIQSKILHLRGQKVILDRDLAVLYGVETRALNQAVRRNISRFPDDFMFQLTRDEAKFLRSQFVTLKENQHFKYMPYAFTEQGVAMLSSVLNSERAVQVNIQIMRVFTKMREMFINYQEIKQTMEDMERKYDHQFKINNILFEEVFEEIKKINRLLSPGDKPRKEIGFKND
jgi:type III secretory pathway component EscV